MNYNSNQKIDTALRLLYTYKDDKYMPCIKEGFRSKGIPLTAQELNSITNTLKSKGLANFQTQPQGLDYRGQITPRGIDFYETTSFSQPGTAIRDL